MPRGPHRLMADGRGMARMGSKGMRSLAFLALCLTVLVTSCGTLLNTDYAERRMGTPEVLRLE